MTGNVEKETEEPNPTTTPLHNFTLISPISAVVADGGDIEAVRHNLMTDFRAAAENTKLAILEHTGDINDGDNKKPSEEDSKPPWTQPRIKKFPIALSREEIEADFAAIHAPIPPRKPKKRPRARHSEFDVLFPGWSKEVTPDQCKVRENNADQSRGEN